jgi:PHAX RNA-binding domain
MVKDFHPLAQQVASQLAETDLGPLAQISRALYVLGQERVEAALAEALKTDAEGGETVASGEDRHTLGGLFFKNLRRDASREEWRQIRTQTAALDGVVVPPLAWADRVEAVDEARANVGTVIDLSLSAAGRPVNPKRQGEDYVVTNLEANTAVPPLSAHLPTPPSLKTAFRAGVGQAQWRKLQGQMQDPDTDMVAYGYPIPNVNQQMVVLFALTTGAQSRYENIEEPVSVSRAKLVIKPGQFVQRGATLVMVVESSQAPKSIMAEYPDLPQRTVTFVVYAAEKQWRKLTAEADPAGRSISLNGICFYDPELAAMTVLAQNLHLM